MINFVTMYSTTYMNAEPNSIETILIRIFAVFFILISIAALWKVFTKAGHYGILCLIPFYNIYVLCKIGGHGLVLFLLCLLPITSPFAYIYLNISVAAQFRKGVIFALGLAFFGYIFYPILAFGNSQYQQRVETMYELQSRL